MLSARSCSKSFANINYLIHMASLGSRCYYYSIWQRRKTGIWRFKSNWVLSGQVKMKNSKECILAHFSTLRFSALIPNLFPVCLTWLECFPEIPSNSIEYGSNPLFLDSQYSIETLLLMILVLNIWYGFTRGIKAWFSLLSPKVTWFHKQKLL